MKIRYLKLSLTLVLGFAPLIPSWGASTLSQSMITTSPPAVNVAAINSSLASGTITPSTGNLTPLQGQFQLQTNGLDSNYDYVLQSAVSTTGGVSSNALFVSGSTPYIILGNNNIALMPTTASIANIKSSPTQGGNPNAIAYPTNVSVSNLQSATLTNSATYGGYYFKILTGTNQNGTMSQSVSPTPLSNTYYVGEDRPGTYQAVLTMSAFRKP